jgi:hypothetical protein
MILIHVIHILIQLDIQILLFVLRVNRYIVVVLMSSQHLLLVLLVM